MSADLGRPRPVDADMAASVLVGRCRRQRRLPRRAAVAAGGAAVEPALARAGVAAPRTPALAGARRRCAGAPPS